MKHLILLFLFLNFSCSGKEIRPQGQDSALFPDGRYLQEAEVSVTATKEKQQFDFNCIVQKQPQEFLFVGYNSFGISLFKIKQKANQNVEAESSIEQIKKNQEFFLKVFSLVKTILTLQKDDPRLVAHQIDLNEKGILATVKVSKYDSLGIPRQISIESPGQYSVKIQTNSYEPMKGTDHH